MAWCLVASADITVKIVVPTVGSRLGNDGVMFWVLINERRKENKAKQVPQGFWADKSRSR
jgi:hypothetical protein